MEQKQGRKQVNQHDAIFMFPFVMSPFQQFRNPSPGKKIQKENHEGVKKEKQQKQAGCCHKLTPFVIGYQIQENPKIFECF